jgi:hypothetical protein
VGGGSGVEVGADFVGTGVSEGRTVGADVGVGAGGAVHAALTSAISANTSKLRFTNFLLSVQKQTAERHCPRLCGRFVSPLLILI